MQDLDHRSTVQYSLIGGSLKLAPIKDSLQCLLTITYAVSARPYFGHKQNWSGNKPRSICNYYNALCMHPDILSIIYMFIGEDIGRGGKKSAPKQTAAATSDNKSKKAAKKVQEGKGKRETASSSAVPTSAIPAGDKTKKSRCVC